MSDLERLVSSQEWCEDARELDFEAWCVRRFGSVDGISRRSPPHYSNLMDLIHQLRTDSTELNYVLGLGWGLHSFPEDRPLIYNFCRNFVSKEADV
jgi:hypothetical protein